MSVDRDALALRALQEIPKLLTLLDRTPVSPTYGCFDRLYWHYRMIDFPCGMSQEFVYPLALAWSLDIPGNPYFQQQSVRDWVEAGIRFAARSAHPDGSCDDYYPFERAAGAAAFSLLACFEAAEIIGIADDGEVDAFLQLRTKWLAEHQESGRLSNHEALIVACLIRAADRWGAAWEEPLRARVARLLSWQDEEGWFDEYGGADPGYLSLTIGLLADSDCRRPDLGLREPCRRAIAFLGHFVHPDGSVGGEYASRGTLNFFPHGLEIAGAWLPEALAINQLALRPLSEGRQPCYSDDHIIGHHLWSWLLTWKEWRAERPGPVAASASVRFPNAKMLVDSRRATHLYCGWSRGGAFKLFEGERLVRSDTGVAVRLKDGRVAVTHLEGSTMTRRDDEAFVVEGQMAWARTARLTPAKMVVLRVLMLSLGRFFPDLVRRMLQKMLVTGRKDAPFRFRRELSWEGHWRLRDEIRADRGWGDVSDIGAGGSQTSVATIMARVWQESQLEPWDDLRSKLAGLRDDDPLIVERSLIAEATG